MAQTRFVNLAVTVVALAALGGCSALQFGNVAPAGTAEMFVARNSLVVYPDPTGDGRFEVQKRAGHVGFSYWCAAGEYVLMRDGRGKNARIYVETPLGAGQVAPSGEAVGFTTNPDADLQHIAAAQKNGLTMKVSKAGENWSAEHGRAQCDFYDPIVPAPDVI